MNLVDCEFRLISGAYKFFSVEVIQNNHIPQCEHNLGKLKWLDSCGSGLARVQTKSELGESLDGEKSKTIRQNILVDQNTKISDDQNNYEQKNVSRKIH